MSRYSLVLLAASLCANACFPSQRARGGDTVVTPENGPGDGSRAGQPATTQTPPSRSDGRPAAPALPPPANLEEWLTRHLAEDIHEPISAAGCTEPALAPRSAGGSQKRYLVRCTDAEFEVDVLCKNQNYQTCLLNIRTWKMTDATSEARRLLVERNFGTHSVTGPDCRGAMATPVQGAVDLFDMACSNGSMRVQVTCKSDAIDSCKTFVKSEERLPYGLPAGR